MRSEGTVALIVLAVMAALYGVDQFLAAQEHNEVTQAAQDHSSAGRQMLAHGKPREALVEFARAHVLDRENRGYTLSLAEAQIADGRISDARGTLEEALDANSNDGRANLLMARVMTKEGRDRDADSYYHRAIYGEWSGESRKEAAAARLELARMLADRGSREELLSELLLLDARAGSDAAMQREIADLFLRAGSPQRAADAYRRLIGLGVDDADVYVALGQAETMAGDYRAAENAYFDALRRRLNDPAIQSRLRRVVKIATLDPTLRRLTSAEKYRRATEIVNMVEDELKACSVTTPPDMTHPAGPITNEMAEARLDQAEKFWKQREASCTNPPVPDDPLPMLMKKLAQ